jgi:hypothetical protein
MSSSVRHRRSAAHILHEDVESSAPENETLPQGILSSHVWCAAVRGKDLLRGDHFGFDIELINTDGNSEQSMKVACN